jgi:predicted ATPase
VLDNCEHLIDAAAGFVDQLTRRGGPVHVLATSREPLNVHGETILRLRPLDRDDALELLVRRIEDRGRECPTGAEAGELMRRVTHAVDRLPLGIELAAAHCDTMTLKEIADAVDEPLELLPRGRRTADPRHHSLRALVEWSVRDLDDLQREVFSRAAVFAGPFTAGALATVTGRSRVETMQALADLVDRSLVGSEEGPAGQMLHSMMATVRAYARELLVASGEAQLVEEHHAQWVMGLVEPWAADLAGWREAERLQLVDVHLPDLRVAHRRFVDHGDAERSVRFAASLHYTAVYRMHAELFAWIGEVAERFGGADVAGTEAILASAAVGAWETGAMEQSAELAQRAAGVHTASLGRGIGAAEVLADLAGFDGDNDAAIRLFDEGLAAARAEGNECREFSALADGAIHRAYGDDLDSARQAIAAARDLLGPEGPRAALAWIDYVEGEALAEQDAEAALVCLRRAVDGAIATSSDFIVGVARLTLAGLEVRVGSLDAAASDLAALLRHWRSAGAHLQQWITLRSVLSFLVARGDHVTAARTLGVLTSDRNLAEITGPDAARLAEARHLLTSRGAEDQFGDWRDRTIDEVVDELLTVLAPPVGVSRASTW